MATLSSRPRRLFAALDSLANRLVGWRQNPLYQPGTVAGGDTLCSNRPIDPIKKRAREAEWHSGLIGLTRALTGYTATFLNEVVN